MDCQRRLALAGGCPLIVSDTPTIKLIATDLDGTLLRPGEIVSERNRLALQRAQEAGAIVVLVTGRPPRSMRSIARSAAISSLSVCSNGAILYDLIDDAIVESWFLDPEVAVRLIIQLREAAPGVVFALEYGPHTGREPGYPLPPKFIPKRETLQGDILELARQPAVKLIAHHPEISAETLLEVTRGIAGETALATYSGVGFIEISAPGIHKAWALAKLCARLDIRAEEVIAFGDMPNDLEMLAWAGHGVAVANAHPTVLQQAKEITASNLEDGVAVVLERLLDNNRRL